MKQYWQKIVLRIDALSLRERAIVFAGTALVLLALINTFFLGAQLAKQKQLTGQIKENQSQIAKTRAEIQEKIRLQSVDPDLVRREQLRKLQQQSEQMRAALLDMQKGLVSPDKMTALLEGMLKQDGKLRLVSMKTLPMTGLGESPTGETSTAAASATAGKDKPGSKPGTEYVYRHGVEITFQGKYLDIVSYLTALEGMPWQLFWGKVKMNVDEYPEATVTLTIFTLSLDKKWLNL